MGFSSLNSRMLLFVMMLLLSAGISLSQLDILDQFLTYTDCQYLTLQPANICPSGQSLLRLCINPDQYPQEVQWTITNMNTKQIIAQVNTGNEQYALSTAVCVQDTDTYQIDVKDSSGDGICCDKGNGNIHVYLNFDEIAYSDGIYQSLFQTSFRKVDVCPKQKSLQLTGMIDQVLMCTKNFSTICRDFGKELLELCLKTSSQLTLPEIVITDASTDVVLATYPRSASAAICANAGTNVSVTVSNMSSKDLSGFPWEINVFNGNESFIWKSNTSTNQTSVSFVIAAKTPHAMGHILSPFYSLQSDNTYNLCESSSYDIIGQLIILDSTDFMGSSFYGQLLFPLVLGNFNVSLGTKIIDSWKSWNSNQRFHLLAGESNGTLKDCNLFELIVDLNSSYAYDSSFSLLRLTKYVTQLILRGSPTADLTASYSCDSGRFQFAFTAKSGTPAFKLLFNDIVVIDEDENNIPFTYGYDIIVSGSQIQSSAVKDSCGSLIITIIPDSFPQETSWKLTDNSGNLVYTASIDNTVNSSESPFLCRGIYSFEIDDSFGDGICCNYGKGSYSLSFNGVLFANSSGVFESSEIVTFVLQDNKAVLVSQKSVNLSAEQLIEPPTLPLYLIFPGAGTFCIILVSLRLFQQYKKIEELPVDMIKKHRGHLKTESMMNVVRATGL